MVARQARLPAWRLELARHDWAALRCGCGESAAHLPHAVPVILAALTEELLPQVRSRLLGMLEFLAAGESHASEVPAGRPGLDEECIDALREGIWQLYAEAASGDTVAALDVLEIADPDEARFAFFRARLARRLRKRTTG